ncbi:arylsulfatase [Alteromonas aestuariivivens]|uniref:Arylsulfatase n=1 Tax=Alteromonas aestuariivivens TaxID=1938339 RepID=A0A3D8MC14_9ALTE|nr:arylsulfatase [Alteromonas aestuariivivens]RDV27982.1 arylsulfatase [Alteromonas aestuariivivens]
MNSKPTFLILLAVVGAFIGFPVFGGANNPAARPNIIVILADDLGFSDLSSYGGEVPTPNLDSLANHGLKFSQFYNTARCSTTRASLLTGMYPHKAGMGYLSGYAPEGARGTLSYLHERAVTAADVLSEAGYFTAMTGKWHLGFDRTPPQERGFQASLVLPAGGVYFPDQPPFNKRLKGPSKIYLNGEKMAISDPRLGDNWYGTDLWTDWGIRFIQQARQSQQPFFLYLAHVAPHFPVMAPQETIEKYRGKFMAGWSKLREARYQRQIELGLIDKSWPLTEISPDVPEWDSLSQQDKERFDHMMAVYAASIEHIDSSVGRLTHYLEEQGLLDNTLILFMSDNGPSAESGPNGVAAGNPLGGPDSRLVMGQSWASLSNTPFQLYKHYTHEGGIATPLIAHWPAGIEKPQNKGFETTPAHVVDILPTLVDISGAHYPTIYRNTEILPMNGVPLTPLFQGKSLSRNEPIFFEHEGNRAVRSDKWKLVSRLQGPWQLFDMTQDRTETEDLFADYPQIAQSMILQYEKWFQRDLVDQWIGPARPDSGGFWEEKQRRYDHRPSGNPTNQEH